MVNNWRSQYTLQGKLDSIGCTWSSTIPGKYFRIFLQEESNKITLKFALSSDLKVWNKIPMNALIKRILNIWSYCLPFRAISYIRNYWSILHVSKLLAFEWIMQRALFNMHENKWKVCNPYRFSFILLFCSSLWRKLYSVILSVRRRFFFINFFFTQETCDWM